MTYKIHRVLLFAAIMLLMAASFINTGPKPQAAVEDVCTECFNNCTTLYQDCRDRGFPFGVCSQLRIRCSEDCLYGVCTTP